MTIDEGIDKRIKSIANKLGMSTPSFVRIACFRFIQELGGRFDLFENFIKISEKELKYIDDKIKKKYELFDDIIKKKYELIDEDLKRYVEEHLESRALIPFIKDLVKKK